MLYQSTRSEQEKISSAQAIKQGIAADGGLFVPTEAVKINLTDLINLTYPQRAALILGQYLSDYSASELAEITVASYQSNFADPQIAPVKTLSNGANLLELWHGPTCAFKDLALQILPRLLTTALAKTGEKAEIVILVATSGDTGKAALEGFKDVPGTRIMVFFPNQGVSQVQKLQMQTQEGSNVSVAAVEGNFDDAQSGVKAIFTNPAIKAELAAHNLSLSSANSINWGRLAPQIVYYFSAYLDLVQAGRLKMGDPLNFVVPTGNFGDILAGYYAKQAGLPVGKLICASNDNKILTDFFQTGIYDCRREFIKTISPSMDILISSNLERLLWHLTDSQQVKSWMAELAENGCYRVGQAVQAQLQRDFAAGFASEAETLTTISQVWRDEKYLLDTHTAVAYRVWENYQAQSGDLTPSVIISTASPFKFNRSVATALLGAERAEQENEFDLLQILSRATGWKIPQGLQGLPERPLLHQQIVAKEAMSQAVYNFLKIN